MRLTDYDRDLIKLIKAAKGDMQAVSYARDLRYYQVLWWSRQPHIAEALAEALTPAPAQPAPQPPAPTPQFAPAPEPTAHQPTPPANCQMAGGRASSARRSTSSMT